MFSSTSRMHAALDAVNNPISPERDHSNYRPRMSNILSSTRKRDASLS